MKKYNLYLLKILPFSQQFLNISVHWIPVVLQEHLFDIYPSLHPCNRRSLQDFQTVGGVAVESILYLPLPIPNDMKMAYD